MAKFSFETIARDKKSRARACVIKTRKGEIETPHFVPVATVASFRGLDSSDIKMLKMQCLLVNTYHLYLNPGEKVIRKFKGAGGFMKFDKPLFSDSGGFQAFSLGLGKEHGISKFGISSKLPKKILAIAPKKLINNSTGVEWRGNRRNKDDEEFKLAEVNDKGVVFYSVYDGSRHFMSAKKSMEIQSNLGSDIIMAFDECTSPLSGYEYLKKSLKRTHKWAEESLRFYDKKQAIYGIVQGAEFKDLREESAKFVNSLPFDGIAIGGSFGDSFGDSKNKMKEVLDWVIPLLDDRPRHLLGIGGIDDIFECVERGIDTFDCILPTRLARHGNLYVSPASGGKAKNKFRIDIGKAKYKLDKKEIDKNCSCFTCKNYSRAYLHHLFKVNKLTYYRISTIHNLHFMFSLMAEIRESIKMGKFEELKRVWIK